jgi:hypothetical protein
LTTFVNKSLTLKQDRFMDQHKEFRLTYLTAAPHSFYSGIAWIASAALSEIFTNEYAILFFILSLSVTFPVGELLRKVFQSRNFISASNKLGQLFMFSAFTIPACYPLVYFLCKVKINYFFPAFSILVGAHYLIFVYAYDRKIFLVLAIAMIAQGVWSVHTLPLSFSIAGYIAGSMIFLTGVYNLIEARKELRSEAAII